MFEIELDLATQIYNTLVAAGCRFPTTSWSPERHTESIKRGRRSPEMISVMDPTPEQRQILKQFDFMGAEDNCWPALYVQKHGPDLKDVYEAASVEEQMKMDLNWLNIGGHLSEEKMDRLAGAGKIGKNWQ